MKKITKLKICNWSLLALTIAILISGIQLEATHSIGLTSVWIHILIGVLLWAWLHIMCTCILVKAIGS